MRLVRLLAVVGLLGTTWTCPAGAARDFIGPTLRPAGPAPWTHLNFNNDPNDFHFAILADRTVGHRPGVFASAVEKLNLLSPQFVMCIGDLIEGYTGDPATIARQWNELDAIVAKLRMPFFYVAGNHDLTNETMIGEWRRRRGPCYYHFLYRNCLFLVLDTEDPPETSISPRQVEYFRKVLADYPNVRWTFVFMHEPMWAEAPGSAWEDIEKALTGRDYTVFAGHWHQYAKFERLGHSYIVLATTGGKSELEGPEAGKFDHITWVAMSDAGPLITNLALDGIFDEDVFTWRMYQLKQQLAANVRVSIEPVLWDAERPFETAKTAMRIENLLPREVHISGVSDASDNLRLLPAKMDFPIPPGKTAKLNVLLQSDGRSKCDELVPAGFRIAATAKTDKGKVVKAVKHVPVAPTAKRACPRAEKSVKIDGNLSEWSSLPYGAPTRRVASRLKNWSGPADSSVRFASTWNDRFVYLALDVTDDELIARKDARPSQQDGVYIWIDPAPQPGGPGAFKPISIELSPAVKADGYVAQKPQNWPDGTKVACTRTPGGYAIELALPADLFDQLQGGRWAQLRMNAVVFDLDRDGKTSYGCLAEFSGGGPAGVGVFERR